MLTVTEAIERVTGIPVELIAPLPQDCKGLYFIDYEVFVFNAEGLFRLDYYAWIKMTPH